MLADIAQVETQQNQTEESDSDIDVGVEENVIESETDGSDSYDDKYKWLCFAGFLIDKLML